MKRKHIVPYVLIIILIMSSCSANENTDETSGDNNIVEETNYVEENTQLKEKIIELEEMLAVEVDEADKLKVELTKVQNELENLVLEHDVQLEDNKLLNDTINVLETQISELGDEELLSEIEHYKNEEERAWGAVEHYTEILDMHHRGDVYRLVDLESGDRFGKFTVDHYEYDFNNFTIQFNGEFNVKGYIYWNFMNESYPVINGLDSEESGYYDYALFLHNDYFVEGYEIIRITPFFDIDNVDYFIELVGEEAYDGISEGDVYYIEAKFKDLITYRKVESGGFDYADIVELTTFEKVDSSILEELH